MSGRYNIVKEFIVKPAAEAVKKVFKKEPKSVEYVVPKIAKNLKGRREDQQKMFKAIDDVYKKRGAVKDSAAAKIKKEGVKKSSEIYDKFEKGMKEIEDKYQKRAKGGRIGLKKGSFPDLSGDGKTTMKDILIGRGVIKNKKGKKKMIAKKFKSPMERAIKKDKKKII